MCIRGIQRQFFASYLTDRTQCVQLNNTRSADLPIGIGVPQGSILGPTLFLNFINDLCQLELFNGQIITFADDTAIIFQGDTWDNTYQHVQNGMNVINRWLSSNHLSLNATKSRYVAFRLKNDNLFPIVPIPIKAHFCSSRGALTNQCTCEELQSIDTIKYLGILIDKNLSFQAHVELLTSRIRKLIFVFKNLRHVADNKVLRLTYLALCQSLLTYCITSWGGAAKTIILKLERAQRAVLKVALFLPFWHPTFELYQKFNVLTVRQLFILRLVYRSHSLSIYDPLNIAKKRRKYTIYDTSIIFKTALSHRFYFFLGPYLYNKINSHLHIYSQNKYKLKY